MSAAPRYPRQGVIAAWAGQIVGTVVIALAVYYYFKNMGSPFGAGDEEAAKWASHAILLLALPAAMYLRKYKPWVDADEDAVRARGVPDPVIRAGLLRSLGIGGALCELPLAMGVLHLLLGGQTKWFVGAALVTIALRLSYRPFTGRR